MALTPLPLQRSQMAPPSAPVTHGIAHLTMTALVCVAGTTSGMQLPTSAHGAHTGAVRDAVPTEVAKHLNLL